MIERTRNTIDRLEVLYPREASPILWEAVDIAWDTFVAAVLALAESVRDSVWFAYQDALELLQSACAMLVAEGCAA